MNTPSSTSEALALQMRESDWRALIGAVRNGNLIPMVGTGLMRVKVGDRYVTYDHLIAQELATRHEVTDTDLAPLGTSISDAALNDVVSVVVRREGDRCLWDLHDDVWQIIHDSSIEPPRALVQLAEISDLDLFVTSSCDSLFETALRSAGNVEARVYRRIDREKEDLPKDARTKKGYRQLYYLLGKAEPGTMDFAICDEDLLRFVLKLQDTKYRPRRLFDALRESNLLLLGVNFGDWLARFFLWLARDRENLNSDEARNLREYLADPKAGHDRPLVLFLRHFSQSTIVLGSQPEDFVDELHRRWSEQVGRSHPHLEMADSRPPSIMPAGAVFISYSRSDAPAAKIFFAELTRMGISAWYDAALKAGDQFDPKLEYNIENCSLFLPLLSTGSLAREQGYFRKEWKTAVERDERFFGSTKGFIVPIVIDEDDRILRQPQTYQGMPKRFREMQMYHCPLGKPSSDLIAALRSRPQKESRRGG
ncbi:MAG TPA: toll/interleukin-1 receptor domain-containing protein [Candidatus Angelobacter sp.]